MSDAYLPRGAPRLRLHRILKADAVIIPDGGCPGCGGEYLRGLRFRHLSAQTIECPYRGAEDATAANDAQHTQRSRTRWATVTELLFAAHCGVPAEAIADPVMSLRYVTGSIRHREALGGWLLDRLATRGEVGTLTAAASPPAPASAQTPRGGGSSPATPAPGRTGAGHVYESGELLL